MKHLKPLNKKAGLLEQAAREGKHDEVYLMQTVAGCSTTLDPGFGAPLSSKTRPRIAPGRGSRIDTAFSTSTVTGLCSGCQTDTRVPDPGRTKLPTSSVRTPSRAQLGS